MSEYQYVAFRAVDGPVSKANLAYMAKQSSRAEVTPWSFENEYHHGDFGGNSEEMLRRGYDFHLHYANFGTRKLLIRLPDGLPKAAEVYLTEDDDSLCLIEDKNGPGAILCIEPNHEPGDLDDIWKFDDLLERLVGIRAEILAGDLRPLYLANLAVARDMNHDPEGTPEPPVPAGLNKPTEAQQALMELYELDASLIKAAAKNSPSLSTPDETGESHADWLKHQPQERKDAWLAELMADPTSTGKQILAAFNKTSPALVWPTVPSNRTIAQLEAAAEEIANKAELKAADKAVRAKAQKLSNMAANPEVTLRQTEMLVKERSTRAYGQIAELLAELRNALAGTDRAGLAEEQAQKLRRENPTLTRLVSEFRSKSLLPKR